MFSEATFCVSAMNYTRREAPPHRPRQDTNVLLTPRHHPLPTTRSSALLTADNPLFNWLRNCAISNHLLLKSILFYNYRHATVHASSTITVSNTNSNNCSMNKNDIEHGRGCYCRENCFASSILIEPLHLNVSMLRYSHV